VAFLSLNNEGSGFHCLRGFLSFFFNFQVTLIQKKAQLDQSLTGKDGTYATSYIPLNLTVGKQGQTLPNSTAPSSWNLAAGKEFLSPIYIISVP
jgi:hypothetical protein